MANRKVYHVVKQGTEWKVKAEGSQRSSGNFDTKAPAVERAKELAKKAELGQVKIHLEKGKIQTEHTYRQDPPNTPG